MTIKVKNIRVEIGEVPSEKKQGVVYFSSFEEMNKILTPPRMEILNIIREKNPQSIYELAKILGKDQGNISKDVKILEKYSFIEIEKQKTGERISSKPCCEIDGIEMFIKIGAGAFGIAKDVLTNVSEEFKDERLENNKKYLKETTKKIIKPLGSAAKKISDKLNK